MFDLSVENEYGESLALTNNPAYIIKAIDGLNPPEAIINTTLRAGHDGTLFNSAYLDNRLLTITIAINGPAERNRNALYSFFQSGHKSRIYYKNGMRDVYIDGYGQSMPIGFFDEKEIFQVSLLCPDPYFHDIEDSYATNDQVTPQLEFQAEFPSSGMAFSTIELGAGIEIINRGNTDVGILVTFTANASFTNPVLTNDTSGEYFGVNTTLSTGDQLVFNSNIDGRAVYQVSSGSRTSKVGAIKSGSTWLMCKPGRNSFTISGTGDVRDLHCSIFLQNKYQGV